LIVNRDKPPFDNAKIRQAMALALDRKAFVDILGQGKWDISGPMMPPPEGRWGLPKDQLAKLPGYGPDPSKDQAKGRKLMESLGYSAAKPLKVKVSTRNIAIYRDPAVILIDQLKKIHIAAELDVVDTSIWHAKVARKDYAVGLNLTGVGVDDPDVNFYENYTCTSERNYTKYCNPELEKEIAKMSQESDYEKRRKMAWAIEKQLILDIARPMIAHTRNATCWHPHVKGVVQHINSIYNQYRWEDIWLDRK
jgi:peptide/nickel transport system substrate-binding protein